ncbi:MAG TPA: gamma-butyrobetaine hydroxylase-like domain-containing protein, partial [Chthoniobacterales bacterium]|nr:gamma-butyrobetaine hydroxylase-like domain-containing protein [Chthoniobacterales bacterium]
ERPAKEYNSRSFELQSYDFVGGYGLQPRWGDGHSTGIYSFAYLRRLAEAG